MKTLILMFSLSLSLGLTSMASAMGTMGSANSSTEECNGSGSPAMRNDETAASPITPQDQAVISTTSIGVAEGRAQSASRN